MKGFILLARMSIDPMVRGIIYNNKCIRMFEIAQKLNSENPRAYLWHGVNLYNTPAFMGGGIDKARVLLEKSIEKFDKYQPQSPIHPNWGRPYAEKILSKCNNNK